MVVCEGVAWAGMTHKYAYTHSRMSALTDVSTPGLTPKLAEAALPSLLTPIIIETFVIK